MDKLWQFLFAFWAVLPWIFIALIAALALRKSPDNRYLMEISAKGGAPNPRPFDHRAPVQEHQMDFRDRVKGNLVYGPLLLVVVITRRRCPTPMRKTGRKLLRRRPPRLRRPRLPTTNRLPHPPAEARHIKVTVMACCAESNRGSDNSVIHSDAVEVQQPFFR